jgi:hypothetical protein
MAYFCASSFDSFAGAGKRRVSFNDMAFKPDAIEAVRTLGDAPEVRTLSNFETFRLMQDCKIAAWALVAGVFDRGFTCAEEAGPPARGLADHPCAREVLTEKEVRSCGGRKPAWEVNAGHEVQ